jgi:hypothetical protein
MAEVRGLGRLFSFIAKKKFGQFNQYGTSQYGWSHYGDEDIWFIKTEFGTASYGVDRYGDAFILSGIYRTDSVKGYLTYYREPYYIPKNPRTAAQQAWRSVFAGAVSAWHELTPEEKAAYNENAKGKRMSGYNLFIREYLLSH